MADPKNIGTVVTAAAVAGAIAVFGIRSETGGAGRYALTAAVLIAFAAGWLAFRRSTRPAPSEAAPEGENGELTVAAWLLLTPWILVSFLAGYGPPWLATAQQNATRYLVLTAGAVAVGTGMMFLRDISARRGEKVFSRLGFSAAVFGTPVYLFWGAILFEQNFANAHSRLPDSPEIRFIADMSDVLLYCGGLLTYLASGFLVVSLARAGLLARRAAGVLVTLTVVIVAFLIVRGPQFPDPRTALDVWYNIPGFVAGVPAVPWLIPAVAAILLLRSGRQSITGD